MRAPEAMVQRLSPADTRALLRELDAPPRLVRHVELVGEASAQLLRALSRVRVPIDQDLVRVGVLVHDIGKVVFPRSSITRARSIRVAIAAALGVGGPALRSAVFG